MKYADDLTFRVENANLDNEEAFIFAWACQESSGFTMQYPVYLLRDGSIADSREARAVDHDLFYWPTRHEAEEFLRSWQKKEGLKELLNRDFYEVRFHKSPKGDAAFYIKAPGGYLWKDGRVYGRCDFGNHSLVDGLGYWSTKEEAEKFLQQWFEKWKQLLSDDSDKEAERCNEQS